MESLNNLKGEHYNLRWNNYSNNLIQVFSEHQHHEVLVDVTLTCEGQFIKAHKLILSACSGFFQDMFNIHSNIQHPFIILNGIKFSHLKHIIEFIYHGEIKILDEDLEGVLALGESFQVKGLSSVKLKHQVPIPDAVPATIPSFGLPSPNAINLTQTPLHSTPVVQQKENIGSLMNTNDGQDKFKVQSPEDFKRIQVNNSMDSSSNKSEHERSSSYNDKDGVEPAIKRTKTPQVITTSTNTNDESLEQIPNEKVQNSEKIPRPTNAFMIFANEWRKKLAVEYPDDNNKGISVRLGNLWKSLSPETKDTYYLASRIAQREHELKYPGYIYNPQEARKRKAVRRKTIDSVAQLAIVNMDENDEDDDLQIVEVNEDPPEKASTGDESLQ